MMMLPICLQRIDFCWRKNWVTLGNAISLQSPSKVDARRRGKIEKAHNFSEKIWNPIIFTLFRQSVLADVKWVWNCCNEAQQYNRQITVSISSASQGVSRQRRSLDMQQTSETYLDVGTSDCRHKLKARREKSSSFEVVIDFSERAKCGKRQGIPEGSPQLIKFVAALGTPLISDEIAYATGTRPEGSKLLLNKLRFHLVNIVLRGIKWKASQRHQNHNSINLWALMAIDTSPRREKLYFFISWNGDFMKVKAKTKRVHIGLGQGSEANFKSKQR